MPGPALERTWREQRGEAGHQLRDDQPHSGPGRPGQLLTLKRGHWAIENRLHRCKDVNLAEDASLIHAGQGPHIMVLLRDAALALLLRPASARSPPASALIVNIPTGPSPRARLCHHSR